MLVIFSIATLLGDIIGAFGVFCSYVNVGIFGYIGYILMPFLLFVLYRFYKNPVIDFRRLEIVVSFCLFFLALLLLQSLIFSTGHFGNAIIAAFMRYINTFGVWAIDIFLFVFAWLIFTNRNLALLAKQTKHKCLVARDFIVHFAITYFHITKSFVLRQISHITPHIKKLFGKKTQDVLDLQQAKQERTTKAYYDFRDVVIEEGFDEIHKGTACVESNSLESQPLESTLSNPISNPAQTPAPLDIVLDSIPALSTQSAQMQNAQPPINTEGTKPEMKQKSVRIEIVESTGQEMKLQDFFANQIQEHKDMLRSLNKHIALTDPAIKPTQATLFVQDSQKSTQEDNTPEQSTSSTYTGTGTIPTPPPRPANPSVFLQMSSNNIQKDSKDLLESLIKDNNIQASKSPGIRLSPKKGATSSTHTESTQPQQIQTGEDSKNLAQKSQIIESKEPTYSALHTPFTPIMPLSSTQTQDSKPATQSIQEQSTKITETESIVSKTPISVNAKPQIESKAQVQATPKKYQSPSLFTPMQPLELDIQEITPSTKKNENPTQWVDSIVQEIPIQKEVHKERHYERIKEIEENKHLLDTLEYGKVQKPTIFKLPPTSLLNKPPNEHIDIDENEIDRKSENLLAKLKVFRIDGDIVRNYSGPIVTTFEFRPAPDVRVNRILTLGDDLAMALSARSIRIQAPVPGKDVVGIEIPNNTTQTIYLREILESDVFKTSTSPLTLALGKDIIGNPFVTDLKKAPHLLIAGTTGSGKSVGLNAMILSLLYKNTPDTLKLLMIDPKKVEFSIYGDIPHLITPIISEAKKAITALNSAVSEMERRLDLMSEVGARDIDTYNRKMIDDNGKTLPYLVIIIDELADLMMTGGKEVEFALARVAQMGRASGIHLIIATQRPSVDVITGLIKANLPSRISYKVGSKIDSKVILDGFGAESLLGRGDMLFKLADRMIRLHAPWSTEDEIEEVADFIKSQQKVEYDKDFMPDEKDEISQSVETSASSDDIAKAKSIFLEDNKTSISFLQRKLKIGYNKAAEIVEQLEKEGFLSKPNARGVREIIGK
ncbi:DNA translocase FtsK [Helicobacter typhlonius]|uniref:DNA translocase FtsK n=1 Tax=Helicobacter typhlonius TaxID=76936 RepID=UPI002FE264D2